MKRILIAVLAFGLVGSAMAEIVPLKDDVYKDGVRRLDEAMTPEEKALRYSPHRDAGHAALNAKRFGEAAEEFEAAANATAFAWVRARMLANAGFALARASRCKEAQVIYDYAYRIWIAAEDVDSGGIKWAAARKQTIADIRWGLFESACKKAK